MESARQFVEAVDKEDIELKSRGRKRKSSERHVYDESTKTAIGKHALMHGNKIAVKKFSITPGFDVPECTVRNLKRETEKQIKDGKDIHDVQIIGKK